MLAILLLLLVHRPPPAASLKVVVPPMHTLVVPVMVEGTAFTVMTLIAVQPLGIV